MSRRSARYLIQRALSPEDIGTSGSIDQSDSARSCFARAHVTCSGVDGIGAGAPSPTSNQPWSE